MSEIMAFKYRYFQSLFHITIMRFLEQVLSLFNIKLLLYVHILEKTRVHIVNRIIENPKLAQSSYFSKFLIPYSLGLFLLLWLLIFLRSFGVSLLHVLF